MLKLQVVIAGMVSVLLSGGCDGPLSVSPIHTASTSTGSVAPNVAGTSPAPDSPPPAPAPTTSASAPEPTPSEEGSIEVDGIIVEDAKIGRPGPGVLSLAADPRYTLRIRIDRVAPKDSEDFTPGQHFELGIHSPSRTFPGGVARGQRVRLRIHWRDFDGAPRRYDRVERAH